LERFSSTQKSGNARAHLTESIEDAIEDDEEWEDGLNWPESSAEDETQEAPEEEAESHSLLSTDLVHEESANDTTREIEAVDHSSVSDVSNKCIVRV
jgi:hypothetical protein